MVTFYGIEENRPAQESIVESMNLCRWCIARQVKSKGDICRVCADGVEESGLKFASDNKFPWMRLLAIVCGFVIAVTVFYLLTK